MKTVAKIVLAVVVVAELGACAHQQPSYSQQDNRGYQQSGQSAYTEYGRVSDIQTLRGQNGGATGAGAVVGAVIGAVVGRQFGGRGTGRDMATGAGLIGGAVIGNEIEKNNNPGGDVFRVTVSLEGGGSRSIDVSGVGDLRRGDRVKIEGGRIFRL